MAIAVAWMVAAGTGCYPGSSAGLSLVELPLAASGIIVGDADIQTWGRFATRTQAQTYELDPQERKFFLSLQLRSESGTLVDAALNSVSYEEAAGVLSLGLIMDTCHRCRFSAAIFIGLDQGAVESYTGETDWFDTDNTDAAIPLPAWLHPTGSLRCRLNSGVEGVALRDIQADLRFPMVQPVAVRDGFEALLGSLPVGRRMAVDIEVGGTVVPATLRDPAQNDLSEVILEVAGQELLLYCSNPGLPGGP
jgi:hypothetical protein